MLAIVCPGQGSQTPGFLAPWLEIPGAGERLDVLSTAAGMDLRAHGTTSDADTIRDTAVAQPLIVAASLLTLRTVLDGLEGFDGLDGAGAHEVADVTAGHSVGELAAAAVAGVLDDADAVALVARRARAMADAAALEATGMSAVVGGDPDEVARRLDELDLHPANVNGGGQLVAAGPLDVLATLAEAPPARARVIALQVAGAFHTPYMASAHEAFAAVCADWPAGDPRMALLSDADGAPYPAADGAPHGRGREVLSRIADQVVAPVRWDLCQEWMAGAGVTGLLELAPAGVLTGLARRTLKGVETVAVRTPDDLEAARDLVSRHGRGTSSAAVARPEPEAP